MTDNTLDRCTTRKHAATATPEKPPAELNAEPPRPAQLKAWSWRAHTHV